MGDAADIWALPRCSEGEAASSKSFYSSYIKSGGAPRQIRIPDILDRDRQDEFPETPFLMGRRQGPLHWFWAGLVTWARCARLRVALLLEHMP